MRLVLRMMKNWQYGSKFYFQTAREDWSESSVPGRGGEVHNFWISIKCVLFLEMFLKCSFKAKNAAEKCWNRRFRTSKIEKFSLSSNSKTSISTLFCIILCLNRASFRQETEYISNKNIFGTYSEHKFVG